MSWDHSLELPMIGLGSYLTALPYRAHSLCPGPFILGSRFPALSSTTQSILSTDHPPILAVEGLQAAMQNR